MLRQTRWPRSSRPQRGEFSPGRRDRCLFLVCSIQNPRQRTPLLTSCRPINPVRGSNRNTLDDSTQKTTTSKTKKTSPHDTIFGQTSSILTSILISMISRTVGILQDQTTRTKSSTNHNSRGHLFHYLNSARRDFAPSSVLTVRLRMRML